MRDLDDAKGILRVTCWVFYRSHKSFHVKREFFDAVPQGDKVIFPVMFLLGDVFPQEKEEAMAKFRADRAARASKAQGPEKDSGVEGKTRFRSAPLFRGRVGEGRVAWTGANLFAASFFVWLKVEICRELIILFASSCDIYCCRHLRSEVALTLFF